MRRASQDRLDLVLPGQGPRAIPAGFPKRRTSPGELSADGTGRVGVVAQVDRPQDGLAEVGRSWNAQRAASSEPTT